MTPAIRIVMILLAFGLGAIGVYFFCNKASSEILISDQMNEFIDAVERKKYRPKHKLILLDLDDTVYMYKELLGTPTWFYNMVNLIRQSGSAKYEAYEVVRQVEKFIQKKATVIPVELATINAINMWQSLGAVVAGVTSRIRDDMEVAHNHLSQLSLGFRSSYFSCIEKSWGKNKGAFTNGVLFVGDKANKGEVVRDFVKTLKSCGAKINLIAYADDQQRYVNEISLVAKNNHTDFIGAIYGKALSNRVFDFSLAKEQLIDLEDKLGAQVVTNEYRHIFFKQQPAN